MKGLKGGLHYSWVQRYAREILHGGLKSQKGRERCQRGTPRARWPFSPGFIEKCQRGVAMWLLCPDGYGEMPRRDCNVNFRPREYREIPGRDCRVAFRPIGAKSDTREGL